MIPLCAIRSARKCSVGSSILWDTSLANSTIWSNVFPEQLVAKLEGSILVLINVKPEILDLFIASLEKAWNMAKKTYNNGKYLELYDSQL